MDFLWRDKDPISLGNSVDLRTFSIYGKKETPAPNKMPRKGSKMTPKDPPLTL
jgi:hypothetical protein